MVFHVLNRGVGRVRIFDDDGDYAAFEPLRQETVENQPMRTCAYCLMPNHIGTSYSGLKATEIWLHLCIG